MAAPTFVAAGTYLTAADGTTAAIAVPSGVQSGDIIIVALYKEATTAVTPPSGFLEFSHQAATGTQDFDTHLFWKRATGSDSGTYSFSWTGSAVWRSGFAMAFRGCVASGSPIDVFTNATSGSTAVTASPAVAVTTTGADRMLVWVGATWDTTTWVTPTNYTGALSTGSNRLLHGAYRAQAAAGSSGSITVTTSQSFTKGAHLLALLPAGAAAVNPVDVIPIGNADGLVHYAFDVGLENDGGRTLYYPSEIAGGLNIDPNFTVVTDSGVNWVQCAARADATTTSANTNNARDEGRETTPGADVNLAFDPTDGGVHWQRFRARVMEQPTASNVGIATGQLHSLQDDTVMVRTRMVSGVCKLVLRVYDPPTDNSVDVLTLDEDYTLGDVYDILFLINGPYCYVFYQDFTRWVYRFPVSILPITGTYLLKWGNYNQFYEGTAGVNATDWGRTHYRNAMHWHTGWAAPTNYPGVPAVTVGSAGTVTVGSAFTRTAGETGSGIIERRWAVLDGPTGSGTEISTATALSWTPTTAGTYTLIYGAKNAEGWSNPTFLQVTASPPAPPSPPSVRSRSTGLNITSLATHAVNLPASITAGDALLVWFSNDETTGTNIPSTTSPGWTTDPAWSQEQGTTTNVRGTLFYKASALGGGSDVLSVNLPTAQEAAWVAYAVQNAGTPIQVALTATPAATSSPVPALSGLPNADYVSLVLVALDASPPTDQTISPPSGYGTIQQAEPAPGTGSPVGAYSMERSWTGTGEAPSDVGWTNAEQSVVALVAIPGSAPTAVAPTVGAGADATLDQYATLSRTATEDNGGGAITSRAWTVVSGPNQVGATIGTAAALSWAPTVGGTYVLRYTATNSAGSGFDELVVTVAPLQFPLTATLRLSATPAVSRDTPAVPVTGGPLVLSADVAAAKQAVLTPTAPLHLVASITGLRINSVLAFLRLSATVQASSNQGAFVTASLRLGASLSDIARDTPAVPVTGGALRLTAELATESTRDEQAVAAALVLTADIAAGKRGALAPLAQLQLSADITDVAHATPVALAAPLRLQAAVSDRFHTGGGPLTALLRLGTSVATSSTRAPQVLPRARLRLFGSAVGQRIIAAITAVTPRADTTVRYDLVAVARIPQAATPPAFVEIDPIDWTEISWTEGLGEFPTLSATCKIGTLTDPILQRLQVPHELPTELWCYRNGRAVFAGPLLGARVSADSISLEAGGIETYLRWMHVVADRQFVNTDQFSIVRALIDQWQGLEYGHFGIDSGSGQVGLLPDPIPGQAVYQSANRTAENSDDDLTVSRPSGTVAGDLLVVAHVTDTDGGLTAMSAPDEWTEAGEQTGSGDIPNLKIWWKIAGESEPSSYVFGQDDEDGALGILRITGHNGTAPIAVVPAFSSSATSSTKHVAPSVAGVAGGLLVTVACADTGGSRRVYTDAPTGMEERVDIGANSAVLGMFTQQLSVTGATGTKTATCSGSHDWIAASLVIAPAPPTPPPLVDYGPLSGVTRNVSYFASELHVVADRIADLAKAADGFDMVIDPITRRLEMYHPGRGIDRSEGEDAVVFDSRNITNSDITFSISPADLASDGFATGTTGGSDAPRTATYANLELRAKFGRTGITATFEVTDQASLDAYVASLVDARGQVLLIPGPNARVTLDADLGAYDVGDTISYHAHGRLTAATAWRIRKRTVRVGEANTETVAIEFV